MSKLWYSANKSHLIGLALFSSTLFSILLMFCVQFSVENLQEQISSTKSQISDYEDRLRLLEVEWVYLTRPERLRQLASSYLKNNGYVLVNQIIDKEQNDIELNGSLYHASLQEAKNTTNLSNSL